MFPALKESPIPSGQPSLPTDVTVLYNSFLLSGITSIVRVVECSAFSDYLPTNMIKILELFFKLECYSVKTEILPDGAQSRLFVANARPIDSGNYTCSLADVAATYVTVQVLNGKY